MFTCYTPDSQLLPIYPAIFKIMHTHNSIMSHKSRNFCEGYILLEPENNHTTCYDHTILLLSHSYSLSLVGLNFKYRSFYDRDIGICLDFVACAHYRAVASGPAGPVLAGPLFCN